MALYLGKLTVKDYDVWRPHFDADQQRRDSVGAKTVSVARSTADQNEVHMILDIEDMAPFAKLMQTPEMMEVMQKSGATSAPKMYKMEELGQN